MSKILEMLASDQAIAIIRVLRRTVLMFAGTALIAFVVIIAALGREAGVEFIKWLLPWASGTLPTMEAIQEGLSQ